MANIQEMNAARLKKALAKQFNFGGQIMTLDAFLKSKKIFKATCNTRTHETHRRDLEYKELSKPIIEYTLWYMEGERELGIDVPKLVYAQYKKGDTTNETP